jgi:hypothetical protein
VVRLGGPPCSGRQRDRRINYLRSVAEEWRNKARTGHLPRPAAWLSFTTTVLKTLQYPLPVTTFTERQCAVIMVPCLVASLPTSRICRTFPRALVYGPLKNQGLALLKLSTVQGIEHTLTVMEFGYNMKTLTGKLLKGNLEALKLELPGGVGTPLFVTDFRRYGTLASLSWTQHTWQWLRILRIKWATLHFGDEEKNT